MPATLFGPVSILMSILITFRGLSIVSCQVMPGQMHASNFLEVLSEFFSQFLFPGHCTLGVLDEKSERPGSSHQTFLCKLVPRRILNLAEVFHFRVPPSSYLTTTFSNV
jgi:hypothetical protein